MFTRCITACLAIALLPCAAFAQDDDIEARLARIEAALGIGNGEGTSPSDNRAAAPASNNDDIEELKKLVENNIAAMNALNDRVQALQDTVDLNLTDVNKILDEISTTDQVTGKAIPRMSYNFDTSSDFRNDMRQTVQKSIRRQGVLYVMNKTDKLQTLEVNGQKHYILPHTSNNDAVQIPVWAGSVTTRLLCSQGNPLSTHEWTIAPPRYAQRIEIVP